MWKCWNLGEDKRKFQETLEIYAKIVQELHKELKYMLIVAIEQLLASRKGKSDSSEFSSY